MYYRSWFAHVEVIYVPACNSSVPLRNDANFSRVSALAACAVGVEPTARTNGISLGAAPGTLANSDKANPAAVFTAFTSVDKNAEAASKEVEL